MIFCQAYRWLLANFVASRYCYLLGYVGMQDLLAKLIWLSYDAHHRLSDEWK